MAGYAIEFCFMVMRKAVVALLTFIFAVGGAVVGIITGAIKGQTTETGLLSGAAVGSVAGAITAIQLLDLIFCGESFSKVALMCSLVNGKIFMEWVSPAVLKAYQWQISSTETGFREMSDIFEVTITSGLSQEAIKKLPTCKFETMEADTSPCDDIICSICLKDFEDGELERRLPICGHCFHVQCIDEWLARHASCPMCRVDV